MAHAYNIISKTSGLLLIAVLFSSCQRGLYISDKVNSPGFTEAGEVKLDVSYKPPTEGLKFSMSADAAYAPIDHLGIIASYRSVNDKVTTDVSLFGGGGLVSRFKGHRFDLGLGYFNTIGEKGKFEAYGGYGNGVVTADVHELGYIGTIPKEHYNARYNRFFMQSAIGFGNKAFSFMGGTRLTFQRYYDFTSGNPELKYTVIPGERLDVTRQTFGFIEPYIQMQAGYKYVSFIYQFGWAAQVSGPSLNKSFGLPYMTFGVLLHYAPRFRNR